MAITDRKRQAAGQTAERRVKTKESQAPRKDRSSQGKHAAAWNTGSCKLCPAKKPEKAYAPRAAGARFAPMRARKKQVPIQASNALKASHPEWRAG